MRDYLTSTEVLAIHDALIDKYGGNSGVRDMGAVEAAVFRPQCGYYADVAQEAAAIMESLLINRPFTDGNKRTAFAVCDVFLRMNGYRLKADPGWLYGRIIGWAGNNECRFEAISADVEECMDRLGSN